MVDRNLALHLVGLADVSASDVVLEVGAGVGSLTGILAERAASVIAVEVDGRLAEIAARQLSERPNVHLVREDILDGKHRIEPAVIAQIKRLILPETAISLHGASDKDDADDASVPGMGLKVVANMPYSVAVPVILNLLESGLPIQGMWVTVQKEIAQRLAAETDTGAYGVATVLAAVQADVRIERFVAASVFWPRPKVESAIIVVTPAPGRRRLVADYELFRQIVAGAFQSRRKRFPKALHTSGLPGRTGLDIDEAIQAAGIPPDVRPGEVAPETYVKLANLLTVKPTRAPV